MTNLFEDVVAHKIGFVDDIDQAANESGCPHCGCCGWQWSDMTNLFMDVVSKGSRALQVRRQVSAQEAATSCKLQITKITVSWIWRWIARQIDCIEKDETNVWKVPTSSPIICCHHLWLSWLLNERRLVFKTWEVFKADIFQHAANIDMICIGETRFANKEGKVN